jgi:hypothetical protein
MIAIGPSAQARDAALMGEEECVDFILIKGDYLDKEEKMVLQLYQKGIYET